MCSKFRKCALRVRSNRNTGGHLVFGNPALPIPENPKARHPTPMKIVNNFWLKEKEPLSIGAWGSHSVFGSPATQVSENPKAEHPTPQKTRAPTWPTCWPTWKGENRPDEGYLRSSHIQASQKTHTLCQRS